MCYVCVWRRDMGRASKHRCANVPPPILCYSFVLPRANVHVVYCVLCAVCFVLCATVPPFQFHSTSYCAITLCYLDSDPKMCCFGKDFPLHSYFC